MIRNKIHRTRPMFVHAPGKMQYIPLWETIRDLSLSFPVKASKPKELTIVTFNNGKGHGVKGIDALESSLKAAGVEFVVLGKDVINWKNRIKVNLLNEFVEKVDTEYLLVSDSSDVVIVRDISSIVSDFLEFKCDALFNAEKMIWPLNLDVDIINFERSLHASLFLNAGLWIGKTRFAKEITDHILKTEIGDKSNSEQVCYKYCYREYHPRMQVDFNYRLFQGINRVDTSEVSILRPYL